MSIFDAFKKKGEEQKTPAKKAEVKAAAKEPKKKTAAPVVNDEKAASVVTPDGRLVATSKKAEAKPKKLKQKKEETGNAYKVLMHPLITEKGSWLATTNQYAFAVYPSTNKVEVRKAIRKVYGVDPVKVNIMNVPGKNIRYGKTEGRTKKWKKAVITLAAGQKIEIQEGL